MKDVKVPIINIYYCALIFATGPSTSRWLSRRTPG